MMTQTMSKYSNRARMSAAVLAVAFCLIGASQGRAEDLSPAAETIGPAAPISGTLFICGGGKGPEAALERFMALAGGPKAHIVVITTASETADTDAVETRLEFWRKTPMAEHSPLCAIQAFAIRTAMRDTSMHGEEAREAAGCPARI